MECTFIFQIPNNATSLGLSAMSYTQNSFDRMTTNGKESVTKSHNFYNSPIESYRTSCKKMNTTFDELHNVLSLNDHNSLFSLNA